MKKVFKSVLSFLLILTMVMGGIMPVFAGGEGTVSVPIKYLVSRWFGYEEAAPQSVVEAVYGQATTVSAITIDGYSLLTSPIGHVSIDPFGVATPEDIIFLYSPDEVGEVSQLATALVQLEDILEKELSSQSWEDVQEMITLLRNYVDDPFTSQAEVDQLESDVVTLFSSLEYVGRRIFLLLMDSTDPGDLHIVIDAVVAVVPYNSTYNATAPTINGYNLVGESTAEIIVPEREVGITYRDDAITYQFWYELYEGLTQIPIHYKFIDGMGLSELAPSGHVNLVWGGIHTITAPDFEGYMIAHPHPGEVTVTVDEEGNLDYSEVIFIYETVFPSDVDKESLRNLVQSASGYYEAEMTELSWIELQNALVDSNEKLESESVTQEEVNSSRLTLRDVLDSIEYIGRRIRIYYMDATNPELEEWPNLANRLEVVVPFGEEYVAVAREFEGFTLSDPSNSAVIITVNPLLPSETGRPAFQFFGFDYIADNPTEPQYVIEIDILDMNHNRILEESIIHRVNKSDVVDSYTVPAPEVYGYILASSLRTLTKEQLDSYDVYSMAYRYTPITGTITVRYLDPDGNELNPTQNYNNRVGVTVNVGAVSIDGYVVLGSSSVDVTLTVEEQNKEVIFTYYPEDDEDLYEYTFIFVDDEENVIHVPLTVLGRLNSPLTIYPPVIEGYRLTAGYSYPYVMTPYEESYTYPVIYEQIVVPAPTGTITVYHQVRNTSNVLEVETLSGRALGTHTVNAKTFSGYTRYSAASQTVTLTENSLNQTVTFLYTANTTGGGGGGGYSGGGGGGSSTSPSTVVTDPTTPTVTVEEARANILQHLIGSANPETATQVGESVTVNGRRFVTHLGNDVIQEALNNGLRIRAFLFNEEKKVWVPVVTEVIGDSGYVRVSGEYVGEVVFLAVEEPTFNDVPNDSWFFQYADRAGAFGFVEGVTNSLGGVNFNPNSTISKAEFYTMVARIFGAKEGALYNTLNPVTPVTGAGWAQPYMQALIDNGYLRNMLTSESPILRIDAMRLLTSLITDADSSVNTMNAGTFTDAGQYNDVQIVDSISGYGDGTLRPDQHITRAEMVALIIKTLEAAGW